MKMKLKKGDQVVVTTGKDKGKKGPILSVMPKTGMIVVEGVALVKRHLKSTGRGQSGSIVERPRAIDASNVMLLDPEEKKGTRVGRVVEEGKKGKTLVRVAKKSGKKIG
jgi:large subunit ribosomal protein L24